MAAVVRAQRTANGSPALWRSGIEAGSARRDLVSVRVVHAALARPAPEEFLSGSVVDVGDVQLPEPGPDSRLRWDLNQLYTALNEQRRTRGLTWPGLALELGCTPSRLTNLRTARMADMDLTMRVTQWLGKPAAEFIHAAQW